MAGVAMSSEDDMHDANDLESIDHDSNVTGSAGDDDDDDDGYYDFVDNKIPHHQQKKYIILSEADIQHHQEEDINKVSTILSLPRVTACSLLRNYNWSVSRVTDEWFADEEKARRVVGLSEKKKPIEKPNSPELTCGICFENYPRDGMMHSAACGHPFCSACWRGYIGTSIGDGPGSLSLRCPDPSCGAAVGQDMVDLLADDEDKEKYSRYLRRSYIEDNRKRKWCPAPGCDYAVGFVLGSGSYDVCCNCSYGGFCWNCTEEAHRPVDCGTVGKWMLKNNAESENLNWILANSKPCPKCKRPIEKDHGCMHMTCTSPCKFEFCWLCLGAWSDHVDFYACNRYEEGKQESERRREMAKNSLERYTHYYERWATNESSRQKALADLDSMMQTEKLGKLSVKQRQPAWQQLTFIIEDAWLQIVECRRVLKWTYAYGFYLPEHEHAKKQFFEYLQGEAESGLERLHQCAEKELQVYIDAESPSKDFSDYLTKLAGLTSITRNYFENLVRALETGLKDVQAVDEQATCSRTLSSKTMVGKGKCTKRKRWSCDVCTYDNLESSICQITTGDFYSVSNAVFAIIRGHKRSLDVTTVLQGAARFFSVLMLTCGFVADVDIESEKYRWMGGARLDFYCFLRIVNMRKYHGHVQFVPARGYEFIGEPVNQNECYKDEIHVQTPHGVAPRVQQCGYEGPKTSLEGLEWRSIDGPFILVWLNNVPWSGEGVMPAPEDKFSDGFLDVVIIKDCPKSAFMSLPLRMNDGSHVKSPYVMYFKVKAFQIKPGERVGNPGKGGIIDSDGEGGGDRG